MNQSKALFNVLKSTYIISFIIVHLYILFNSPKDFLILLTVYGLAFLSVFLIGLIISLPVILVIDLLSKKRDKEIEECLAKCDDKLKKGEMTKEENEAIHFYYEDCFYN